MLQDRVLTSAPVRVQSGLWASVDRSRRPPSSPDTTWHVDRQRAIHEVHRSCSRCHTTADAQSPQSSKVSGVLFNGEESWTILPRLLCSPVRCLSSICSIAASSPRLSPPAHLRATSGQLHAYLPHCARRTWSLRFQHVKGITTTRDGKIGKCLSWVYSTRRSLCVRYYDTLSSIVDSHVT
jgi:hypothetical protein